MNKININREKLSGTEIEKFKNFKALESKYLSIQTNPLLKNFWIKTSLYSAVAVLVGLGLWLLIRKNNPENLTKERAFINPPLPQYDISYKSFLYNTGRDSVIQVTVTSEIELKKNTLVDSSGKMINGIAEIRYREFKDPAEIFLSGIPMNYDSAGQTITFQSAGMIEIKAFQNNKPLYISLGKTIKISFVSPKTEKDYNLYYLDTVKRNWVYKGKDKMTVRATVVSTSPNDRNVSDSSLNTKISELQKPEPPALADSKKWHFKLDILPKEFPELAGYTNTLFEVDETYKPLNPSHAKVDWTDVSIEKAQKPLHYFVSFSSGDSLKCRYLVHPVLTGQDYKAEMSNYERKFKTYQQKLIKRKQEEARLSQQVLAPERSINDSALYDIWSTEGKVTRSFEIMNFGIWNCDKPFIYNCVIRKPLFKVNDTIYQNESFLADYTHNVVQRILPGSDIKYDKSAKNLLVMVIGKNRVTVFKPKDFSKVPAVSEYTFQMQPIKNPFYTTEELIEQLRGAGRE